MKVVQFNFFLLAFVAVASQIAAGGDHPEEHAVRVTKVRPQGFVSNRLKRQTEPTTTPRPKKHRPSNIFSLISVLLTETREDASRAFNEIGTLFGGQFSNATTPKATTTSTTPTPSTSSSSDGDSDEDNEITTTTEQYRISRDEFIGILRSNVQGIVNLFGKEFRVAIKDSNQNVREFGRDLGVALRPYFNGNFKNTTKSNN